jgi:hypothetical protein
MLATPPLANLAKLRSVYRKVTPDPLPCCLLSHRKAVTAKFGDKLIKAFRRHTLLFLQLLLKKRNGLLL